MTVDANVVTTAPTAARRTIVEHPRPTSKNEAAITAFYDGLTLPATFKADSLGAAGALLATADKPLGLPKPTADASKTLWAYWDDCIGNGRTSISYIDDGGKTQIIKPKK